MAISTVQAYVVARNSPTAGTSLGATFGSTPTSGSLLISGVSIDKNATSITVPTGFTAIGTQGNQTDVSYHWAYKISDASETGAQTWSWTTSRLAATFIAEYQEVDTLDDEDEDTYSGTPTTSKASGTTATTSEDDALFIAFWGSDSGFNTNNGRAYTGGFSETAVGGATGGEPGLHVADLIISTAATGTSTFSTTSGGDQIFGKIAAFVAASGGGSGPNLLTLLGTG